MSRPTLQPLEPRHTPASVLAAAVNGSVVVAGRTLASFPGWEDVSLAVGPEGEVAIGAHGERAGPHVKVYGYDGRLLANFMAFDPGFRGGVSVALGDDDGDGFPEVFVGAGPGGGPVVKAFDGRTFALIGAMFVGDPNSRDGVADLSASVIDTRFEAVPYGPNPGDPTLANLELSQLPRHLQERLRDAGKRVLVYGGYGLFNVPELVGLPGYVPGAPEGTYRGIAYVPGAVPLGATTHAAWHLLEETLTDAEGQEFTLVWLRVRAEGLWPKMSEANSPSEAFAESGVRWQMGETNPAGVDAFFNEVFGRQP